MTTNGYGRECPSWCAEDHQAETNHGWCESARFGATSTHAEIEQKAYADAPELNVWVVGDNRSGIHTAQRLVAGNERTALQIAEALDIIAGMRKPEIRALAANVRKAAAEAWPEVKEAEAG